MKEPPISRDRRFGGFLYPDQAGGFRADGPEPSASGICSFSLELLDTVKRQ
uniref:Uncharacterized protein n=1 Tax=Siphoviridae sp. ctKXi8 TaxID=2826244 RepID=A0A8S5MYK3_9CAUD|nr:MAG TPA: hypothetical protein [Siphoviridae sp. ctKXi8]